MFPRAQKLMDREELIRLGGELAQAKRVDGVRGTRLEASLEQMRGRNSGASTRTLVGEIGSELGRSGACRAVEAGFDAELRRSSR